MTRDITLAAKHRNRSRTEAAQRTIVRTILGWYRRQGRSLPWRNITDPYRLLISEVMLQQTQVHRVLLKFPQFLRQFPTFQSLAGAPRSEVVRAWRGMGYNNRAVRLHILARTVMDEHGGKLPDSYEHLIALPGVGRYTANALLTSAFRRAEPIVEINIRRVFSRLWWTMHSVGEMRPERQIWDLASLILPPARAYEWNQALMDLGAVVCSARNPSCGVCPVARWCKSRKYMQTSPPRTLRVEPTFMGVPHRVYRGRIIEQLRQLEQNGELPTHKLGEQICRRFSHRNGRWLAGILESLQKDGLVRIAGKGSYLRRTVTLA